MDGAEGAAGQGAGARASSGGADAYDAPFDPPAPTNGAGAGGALSSPGDDAYDSPFGALAVAAPESGGEEAAADDAPAASILGKMGGAMGGALGKISIGEVGGNLWERSSAVRQSLSSVTQDVASAMKEELAGVSSTVGERVTAVSELVAVGSDDEHTSGRHSPGVGGMPSCEGASVGWAGEDEGMAMDPSQLQDMQEVAASEFEELDQSAFYSASLDTPTSDSAAGAPSEGLVAAEGGSGKLGNGVAGLLGAVNMASLNQVAGNLRTDALLGGASKLGKVGSELWGKSSGMREQLTNVTKDVASAMTEEVKGIASIITVDDEDDDEEEEEEEDQDGEEPRRRQKRGGFQAGGEAGEDAGRSPAGEGMHSLHAAEGMKMELEGLEMEREMLQARVASLEDENRELQDQLSAVLQEGSAQRMVLGDSDRVDSGGREKAGREREREGPAIPPRALEGALGTVEEAVALCEKHVQSDSPLAATLTQLKAALTALQQGDSAAARVGLVCPGAGSNDNAVSGAGESATQVAELTERLRENEEERAKLMAQIAKMKEVSKRRGLRSRMRNESKPGHTPWREVVCR